MAGMTHASGAGGSAGGNGGSGRAGRFGDGTRRILLAIAAAALPSGDHIPAASDGTLRRLESQLAGFGPGRLRGYARMVAALDQAARLSTGGRRLRDLSSAERVEVLRRWLDGSQAQHALAMGVLMPLAIAHFEDPAVYAHLGAPRRRVVAEVDRWESQIVPGTELEEGVECDVVIVGTGAGGGVVAKELAEAGFAVLMLEEGEYWRRDAFTSPSMESLQRFYRDKGAQVAVGNTVVPVFAGRMVGGSTAINSGTCFRTPASVLSRWAAETGIADLDPEMMEPFLDAVESELRVTEADPRWVGGVGRVIARGCDVLGYSHGPLRRNAPDCDGAGTCEFGCPTGAKQSTNVSYVPAALRCGAMVATGTRAERVLLENGRAVGIEATVTETGRTLSIRARATVLACGTIHTPALLLRQGLGKSLPMLGRNLTIHPAGAVSALFEEEIRGYAAIPQGYSVNEFHDEGILFEGATLPIDLAAIAFDAVGDRLVDIMENYDRTATFGYMIVDRPNGRVRVTRSGRPLITYRVGRRELRLAQRAVTALARILLAAGATEVHTGVHGHRLVRGPADLGRLADDRLGARHFVLSAYHPLGTARMASSVREGVVSAEGEVFGVRDLFLADGSILPGTPTVNPQVTIMAFAARVASRLAIRLEENATTLAGDKAEVHAMSGR